MASWKKHFKIWEPEAERTPTGVRGPVGNAKFASWLQDVYSGQPNRTDRYVQYDQMDQDSEINAALDTIAEFCTQINSDNQPFDIKWKTDPTDSESKVVNETLRKWCAINSWEQKIFRTFRSAIKYGDHIFLRDPETFELYWVNPRNVKRAVINEVEGRAVEQYVITNLHPNLAAKVATHPIENVQTVNQASPANAISASNIVTGSYTNSAGAETEVAIDSNNLIHISLSEGLDENWPFGASILDSVFKIFKQKELLEDAIIIYRVQRAPERRVFYIDVGNMPSHQAQGFIERVKNEIHQRRIPTRTGGSTVLDASYNPLSIMEDFFFAQTADGRGSKVEVLPGGQGLGEIDDLKFFTNKLLRGLRIPSSYLPTGPDDSAVAFTDGRVGTALIQEYRFNRYCRRLQGLIAPFLDKEFKTFLKHKGMNIDTSTFDIDLLEPQNFSDYREIEINNARASVFTQLAEVPYLAHRFKLQKFLGLSEDEILENERLWREENDGVSASTTGDEDIGGGGGVGFGDIGASLPGEEDMDLTAASTEEPADTGDEGTGVPADANTPPA
jgi:hypothetical protein